MLRLDVPRELQEAALSLLEKMPIGPKNFRQQYRFSLEMDFVLRSIDQKDVLRDRDAREMVVDIKSKVNRMSRLQALVEQGLEQLSPDSNLTATAHHGYAYALPRFNPPGAEGLPEQQQREKAEEFLAEFDPGLREKFDSVYGLKKLDGSGEWVFEIKDESWLRSSSPRRDPICWMFGHHPLSEALREHFALHPPIPWNGGMNIGKWGYRTSER